MKSKRPFYGNQYVTKEKADEDAKLSNRIASHGPTNRQLLTKRAPK